VTREIGDEERGQVGGGVLCFTAAYLWTAEHLWPGCFLLECGTQPAGYIIVIIVTPQALPQHDSTEPDHMSRLQDIGHMDLIPLVESALAVMRLR
jgi:hypothetical protein